MFVTIETAIEKLRAGEFLIVVDEESEQSTGDLLLAAEQATAKRVNFMLQHARGLVCVALTGQRAERLNLPPMVPDAEDSERAAFTVSVDARSAGTGDSAEDRATTIRALVDPETRPADLNRPGHVFPIRAAAGGVLQRAGHTEAAVDLARLAGLTPAGVTCRILAASGRAANLPELQAFAAAHELSLVSLADLIRYRRRTEKLVRRGAETVLPSLWGDFRLVVYTSLLDGTDYLAVIKGDPATCDSPLVRVHSGCVTGDVLGSLKCDCGWQLQSALSMIEVEGCGVVVYVASHEGRGIGLANKIAAYHLQDEGMDTVQANLALGFAPDLRDYGLGAQVLADLGITRMRLMTNNPAKFAAMEGYGLQVVERVPLEATPNPCNRDYLETKREKMGHLLEAGRDEPEG
jgi:3,4-dihydroxy 2-butanone 4-phosphate synthase/GTP cyclohydrolase II